MKYYAVTKGRFSDYHIITITADKEKAELTAKYHTASGYDGEAQVEEFEDNVEVLLPLFQMDYWNNEIKYCADRPQEYLHEHSWEYEDDDSDIILNKIYEMGHYITVFVLSKSEEQAKKIAYDLIAEYKAKNAGIV